VRWAVVTTSNERRRIYMLTEPQRRAQRAGCAEESFRL
jgi:hypothetical protein